MILAFGTSLGQGFVKPVERDASEPGPGAVIGGTRRREAS